MTLATLLLYFFLPTVDRVLRARGKMKKNEANGPVDCLVAEMLQCLPTETAYEVACWFGQTIQRRMSVEHSPPRVLQETQTPGLKTGFSDSVRSLF